jgi:branched-chain amino acid transport system permease protein
MQKNNNTKVKQENIKTEQTTQKDDGLKPNVSGRVKGMVASNQAAQNEAILNDKGRPQADSSFKRELKRITSHPYFGFILSGIVFILMLFIYMGGGLGISTIRALGLTLIYFIIGLGFTLLLGYSGLASLGTAGFIGMGAYSVGYFIGELGVPPLISFVLSIIIAVLIGAAVGFISLRIEGMYLAIITLGLSEILNEVFKNADSITGGVNGMSIKRPQFLFSININMEFAFAIAVVVMVLAMIITTNIIKSPTGRAMLSMKNSTSAAQAMGISLLKYRLLAFVLSTVYAVIGGGIYMLFYRFTIPSTWNLALSLNILAAVIVGGAKSIWGVFIGTFLIFGFDLAILSKIEFFTKNPNASLIISGVLIIVIVMFYPLGLIQFFKSSYYKIRKWITNLIQTQRRKRYGDTNESNQDKGQYIFEQRQKVAR